MPHEKLPTLNIDNQHFTFAQIHQLAKDTPFGFRLSYQQVRWDRFQPDNISNYYWQSPSLIGLDANNFEHGLLTRQNTQTFIEYQNQSNSQIKFDSDEHKILLTLGETHDFGEGITKKGDVNFENKTDQDNKEELKVIEKAITDIIGTGPEAKRLASSVRFYLSSEGINTKIGHAFNTIEMIGYLQTAIRTWQKSISFTKESQISASLQLITNNVFINCLSDLTEASFLYPRVKVVLQNQKHWINQAVTMPQSIMDQYDQKDKIPEYKRKFAKAKSAWNQWIRNPNNVKINY